MNLEGMSDLADTICALSTPPGRSGIAVVRLSGNISHQITRQIFLSKNMEALLSQRRLCLGRIVDPRDGLEIDEAIVCCYRAPHSYTGEDMTEFSLHGSPVLVRALMDLICTLGARIAEPGEFTLRAFLHGRMDLTQAEAVKDIIEAKTLFQAQTAGRQRAGALAMEMRPVKELLIDIIVNLETAVEFAEENLKLVSREVLVEKLKKARERMLEWIGTYRQGRLIQEGCALAIVGRPNVGKSSIFNALLKRDRAIVAEMPGTTRDLVAEYTNLGGIPVYLQDTAGLHQSEDHIEKMGMERSRQAIQDADAILLVVDESREFSKQDEFLKSQLRGLACIVVMNKSDLSPQWTDEEKRSFAGDWPYIEVSAKSGSLMEELRSMILSHILGEDAIAQNGIMITNLRHCHAIENAERSLSQALAALNNGLSEEFALVDLHKGLESLGEIAGETHVEDLLTEIFSKFCIGK